MARIPRFRVPDLPAEGTIELRGAEHHHLAGVLRRKVGDEVRLFDGRGEERRARVAEVGRERAVLVIEGPVPVAGTSGHALAVAVPRASTFDLLVRYATELGLDTLVPLRTARGVARAEGEARRARWRRIAGEAAKQCGRGSLLRIPAPCDLGELCEREGERWPGRLIASPGAETPLAGAIREAGGPFLVAVGPEGGFTDEEVVAASALGFVPVRLTQTVLRVDTAAVATMALLATH
ncbi:MAG: 16S rRNA (uracil(1498)-N(3))-methyltransferase [Planctomycetes bacterium]|nr:16S rRNA (uracil(1498)-N(3))-methyltransferase [Planctomycetota bacterium]